MPDYRWQQKKKKEEIKKQQFAPDGMDAGWNKAISQLTYMRCTENGSSNQSKVNTGSGNDDQEKAEKNDDDDDIEGNMYFCSMETRTEITTGKNECGTYKNNFIRTKLTDDVYRCAIATIRSFAAVWR